MKRSIAFLFACSIISAASVAQAADQAVLFIPAEATMLIPAEECPIAQGGNDNAALNCVAGLEAATEYTPPDSREAVVEGLRAALMPFGVRITDTRPPEYVPYMMLLPGDDPVKESTSRSCTGAGVDCNGLDGGVNRNEVGFTNGGTMNCMMPDAVGTALMAFGYMSGLENNDNPMDAMFYPPDFANAATEYVDMCSAFVPQLDMKGMEVDEQCPSFHEPQCDAMEGQVNSFQDMITVYGEPAAEDTTAPTVDALSIMDMDGMVLPAGTELDLTATVSDDSGYVFVRWTVTSESLIGQAGVDENGRVCKGHNDVCAINYDMEALPPYYQVEGGEFNANDFSQAGLLGGAFTITFEASDLAGNAIETVTATVTVEGGAVDTTGGEADTTAGDEDDTNDDNDDDNDEDSDGEDTTGGDDGDDTTPADDEAGGCACNTTDATGGAAFLLLGLVGFGVTRRRR